MVSAAVPRPADAQRQRIERFLLLAFFASGTAGLVFEVVWTRMLVLVFGATSLAVSSVLAAYMAGLGLGGFLGGRLATRLSRPLRTYGLLEGAIALYGLSVPLLFRALDPLYRALHQAYAPHFLAFSLLRFVVVFAVLLVPTTLMGATLPVLSRFAQAQLGQAAQGAARLYTANTAGAVCGTLLAGFYLLDHHGVRDANFFAAGIGLLLTTAVLFAARELGAPAADAAEASAAEEPQGDELGRWVPRAVALGFALSGAASMINEVAWTRALVLVMGPSTYAFSIMLATFLLGMALGSAAGAWVSARFDRPALGFALAQALAAALTVLALVGFEPMEGIYRALSGAQAGGRGPLALGSKFFTALALLAPAAFCFGASFPLAAAVYARGRNLAARVGELYGANTLGCIAGSLAAGFLLVPRLGLEPSLALAATLNLAVGAALLLMQDALRPTLKLAAALALGFLGAALLLKPPSWDAAYLVTGVHDGPGARIEVLFHEPGYNATISVNRERSPHEPILSLRTDGKADGSDVGDFDTQGQLGLVPLLFHPDPKDVLVVGLATGTTCGAMLKDARIQRMDVLEIERAMVHASHWFDHMNGRPLEDPRTHLIETDARNHYRVSSSRYDVIVSEPSNPWMSGPSHLFTVEAFREAHGLLKPGGVMLQWMQGYALQPDTAASILGAFRQSFPHVRVFSIPQLNDFMMLGSDAPLPLDLKTLATRFDGLSGELSRSTLHDPLDLAAELVGDERSIDALTAGRTLNTDDNGFVEFHAPRDQGRDADIEGHLASAYAGPYAELEAQGLTPDEIGGRMGFRAILREQLGVLPRLQAYLHARGREKTAAFVEAAALLQEPREKPETPWQSLLVREAAWLRGRPETGEGAAPAGAHGYELALLGASGDVVASKGNAWSFRAAREAAERGDCGPLKSVWADALLLRDQLVPHGLAQDTANATEIARALERCGQPEVAETFVSLAHGLRARLANLVEELTGGGPEAALAVDPESTDALLALAHQRCTAGDVAGERTALVRLVERDRWRAPQVARLAHLARELPATDPARILVERSRPYLPKDAPAERADCP